MGAEGHLVAKRFARGCRCFGVFVAGGLAGYGWLSTGPEWIGELQVEIRPLAAEGYVWNCVTLPEHRRQGVFRLLVAGIADIARREGLKRLWIGSVAIPAERALAPAGFRPAARFRSMSLAWWHVMTVSPEPSPAGRDAIDVLPVRHGVHVARSRRRTH